MSRKDYKVIKKGDKMGKEEKFKVIPKEELEKQIADIIKVCPHAEEILAEAIKYEGRCGLAHRTLRDLPSFIGEVIFGDGYIEYSEFKYDPDNKGDEIAIIRWCALYLIETQKEMGVD